MEYLSRAWDLQRHEGEKLTDFAGRLENTIREATVHITAKFKSDRQNAEMTAETAFSLMGAMLMSEKIKAWTPNIYPHLVKTMDRHYSAGGIASDAQRYLDRGIKTDITTAAETTALMASQPTHSDKSRSLERDKILADVQLQLLDLNKQLRQTHRRNPSIVDWKSRTAPTYNMKHNRAQRRAGQPSQQVMCKNFLRGRACFKGNRCPYFHPPHTQAHIATTDTGLPGTDSDQHNHEHATRFDELDFRLGPNEMWWLVPRSMYPLSIITHLTFKSDLISDRPCSDQPPQQRHHILRCRHVGFRMHDLHHSHFSLTRRCKKTHVQIQHLSQGNRREHLYSGQAHLRHYLGWRYFPRFLQRRHTDHDIRHSHLDRSEHTRIPHTVILYYR